MSRPVRDAERVRIRVVVGHRVVPAWIADLLEDIAASPGLLLTEVLVRLDTRGETIVSPEPGRACAALSLVDGWLFGNRVPLLMPVSLDSRASLRRFIGSGSAALTLGGPPDAETPDERVDVVVDLGIDGRIGDVPAASSVVWWLSGVPTGDLRSVARDPKLTTAVYGAAATVAFELCAREPGREDLAVLYDAKCPAHPSSPLMTGAFLAASARQLIVSKLRSSTPESLKRDLSREGPSRASAGYPRQSNAPTEPRSTPRSGAGPRAVCSHLARVAETQARKAAWEKQWQLLLGRRNQDHDLPDPSRLQPVSPPSGRFWADPFAVVFEGRTHVFFEEYVHAQHCGRIAVMTLDAQGVPGPVMTALELDTHLSYPCVFAHEGRLFMIPENAANGRLDLYECVDVPIKWTLRRTLIDDIPLVDASLVQWEGSWWLFASLRSPQGTRTAELLLIYTAEDPVDGIWRSHGLNPILADVTNARPAGAPFVKDGRLHRLAQDGSRGYGWAIGVNEVLALTSTEYAERRVATLRPTWRRGLCGVHTLNSAGDTVVMDACRYVPRENWPRLKGGVATTAT